MSKKIIYLYAALLAGVLFIYGCTQQPTSTPTTNIPPAQQTATVVKASESSLGTIITDTGGMTLYIFQKDTGGESACYGNCATFWPPLLVPDTIIPKGQDVTAALGVTKRTDNTFQVTANGMPLYYFAGDKTAGDVNGQGSNGSGALWYVLSPAGDQIRTPKQNTITSSQNTPSQATASQPQTVTKLVLMTSSSSIGVIITDLNGMALYIFRADKDGKSTCYGSCASYWQPLLVPNGTTPTGQDVTATLGVTKRTDNTFQVTANGMPLYYFAADRTSGETKGQGSTGFGALWYVLSPAGDQITTPNPKPSSSSGGSGGGY